MDNGNPFKPGNPSVPPAIMHSQILLALDHSPLEHHLMVSVDETTVLVYK